MFKLSKKKHFLYHVLPPFIAKKTKVPASLYQVAEYSHKLLRYNQTISQCSGYNQKEKNKCYIIFWNAHNWKLLEKRSRQFLLWVRFQKECSFLHSSISFFFSSNFWVFYQENNIAEFVQGTCLLKMILKSLSKMTVQQQVMSSERLLLFILFIVRELSPETCSLLVSSDLFLLSLLVSVGGHMKQGSIWTNFCNKWEE